MAGKKLVKKKKVEVVFDPKKRRDFLTGFQKRKTERRKKAQTQFESKLKEERKRIKQEIKEGFKHMKKSFEPLRELTAEDRIEPQEYEDDDVKVHIEELTTSDMAAHNQLLGLNHEEVESEEESKESVVEEEAIVNFVPGMELTTRKKQKKLHPEPEVATNKKHVEFPAVSNKKELNRLVKNKTMKQLKKSKVFKQKERLDQRANKKKKKRELNNTVRSLPRYARKKLKNEPSRYSKGRMMNRKQYRKIKENT